MVKLRRQTGGARIHFITAYALALLCATIISCNDHKTQSIDAESPIQLSHIPPERGDEIIFGYNTKHPNSEFGMDVSLFANVIVTTTKEYEQYQLKMNPSSDSVCTTLPVRIPNDAVWISVEVAP